MPRYLKNAFILLLLCFALGSAVAQQSVPRLATESEVRDMLIQAVDVKHSTAAIIVGVITRKGRAIVSYGKFDADDPRVPDGKTVFEIGSVSKVFTALLLCDMALKGEVNLSDPVAKYLPESVVMPTRNGKQITLLELATHHSGLPRMPTNFSPKDPGNPYIDYSPEQMFDFLSHYTLTRDPGAKYDYSNLGVGLLGYVLALHAGTDYPTLLHTRITVPLQMDSTAVYLTPEMKENLAPGHDAAMKKTANWDIPTLAGAGGIRSDVDDMLTFLAANMGLIKSPLQPAMKKMLSVRKFALPGTDIAMGWHIAKGQNEMVWHNGGTGGYHSFVGFEPHRKVGVVVFSNSGAFIDEIGRRTLDYQPVGPVEHRIGPDNRP